MSNKPELIEHKFAHLIASFFIFIDLNLLLQRIKSKLAIILLASTNNKATISRVSLMLLCITSIDE